MCLLTIVLVLSLSCVLLSGFTISVMRLSCSRARHGLSADDQLIIKMVLAGAFYPNYFTMHGREEELAHKEMSGYSRNTTVVVRKFIFSISLLSFQFCIAGGSFFPAMMFFPASTLSSHKLNIVLMASYRN